MLDIPQDTLVSVVVRNPTWPHRHRYAYHVPQVLRYTGKVVPTPKWAGDDLALTTGQIKFPIRLIARADVISVDGKMAEQTVAADTSWVVPGSKGNSYTVSNQRGHWACTCAGFQFKKNCRHVTDKQREMQASA